MQVTFMTRLKVALIEELKKRGFEIGHTDVTGNKIEIAFRTVISDYAVTITDSETYLKLTGKVRKKIWQITGSRADLLKEEYKISGDENIRLMKRLDVTFSMKNIDKDATDALARDIIGSIVNLKIID